MPALINIQTDLKKLRSQPKPFNTQIYSYSSNLVELKTNLTELKFGADQQGYGSSGLPYIQTKIPTASPASPGINPIYRPGAPGSSDYPIRGGSIDFQIGQQTYTLSNKIDSTRIKKFFEDKQRGTLFIQKQIGLQLSNPKMEVGNTLFGLGQGTPVPGLLEITRVYNNGVNTLAQVGVAGTGAHAVRHGLTPFNVAQKNYFAIVNAQNVNNEGTTNRLLNLNALKMTVGASPFVNPQNVLDIETVNNLGISLNRNLLFQYLGGPGSSYGIGATTIKRVVDTTKLRSSRVMTYDLIKEQQVNAGISEENKRLKYNIQDFRNQLEELDGTYVPWGKTVDNRFYYKVPNGRGADKMNSSLPFVFPNDTAPWEFNKDTTDDLIKFVFEAVSNDNTNYSLAIFFRAFLTSGITDNNSAQWNNFKYLGRGENFYTYQGFDRSISFSFRVAAESKSELIPMYNRLNTLVSQVYPDYSPTTNIMRAPVIMLTIGDYLYRMPGFLESVNLSIGDSTVWDTQDPTQLPQVVDVSISFKPILPQLPKRSTFGIEQAGQVNVDTTEATLENPFDTETFMSEQKSVGIIANDLMYNYADTVATRQTENFAGAVQRSLNNASLRQLPLVRPAQLPEKPQKTGVISVEELQDNGFDTTDPNNAINNPSLSEVEKRLYNQAGANNGTYLYSADTGGITKLGN